MKSTTITVCLGMLLAGAAAQAADSGVKVVEPPGGAVQRVEPGHQHKFSDHATLPPQPKGSASPNSPGNSGNTPAAAKKAAKPDGTWRWTVPNRNGQPVESVLKVSVSKDGGIAGTLNDSFGTHPIESASVAGDALTFVVKYDSPGLRSS